MRRRAARVSGPVTQSIGAAVQSSGYASSRGLRRSRTFGRDCDLSPRSSQARSTAGFAPHCLIPCAENAFSVEDASRESALTVVRKIAAARAHRHPTSPDGAAQARHRHLLSARGPRAPARRARGGRAPDLNPTKSLAPPGLTRTQDKKPHVRCLFPEFASSGTSWSIARPRGRVGLRPLPEVMPEVDVESSLEICRGRRADYF